ncbi:MAG: hypothetical protein ACOX8Q_09860, partial [Christensenellales bacterium]
IKADFYRFTKEDGKLQLDYNDLSHGKKNYYNQVLNPEENIEVFKFIMNTWSGIYKREFINKYNIRHNETPGASYQDNGFYFQTFCRASRVFFVDKPFYMNRRDNPNSSVKSKSKVFCIRDEYIYIRDFLDRNPELKEKYIYIYSYKKYSNYWATYKRVADEFKAMFIEHFSEEFQLAHKNGELDKALFSPGEWKRLDQVINEPEKFFVKTQTQKGDYSSDKIRRFKGYGTFKKIKRKAKRFFNR